MLKNLSVTVFAGLIVSLFLVTSCSSTATRSDPVFFNTELSASFVGVFALTDTAAESRLSANSASRVYAYSLLAGDLAFANSKSEDPQADAATAIEYVASNIFKSNLAKTNMKYYRLKFSPEPTPYGEQVGKTVVRLSLNDGFLELANQNSPIKNSAKYETDPMWQWEPTGLTRSPGFEPEWGILKPIITSTADCKLDPPDFATLEKEAAMLLEKTTILQDSTETEIFLSGDFTPTPAGQWLRSVAIAAKNQDVTANVMSSLLAKVAVASYDVSIATWRDKFFYNIARPETMWLRLFDKDIVLARETPPHPSYPSGHSAFSKAAASMLWFALGDVPISFSAKEDMIAEAQTLTYPSQNEAVAAASRSRVDALFHYPTDTVAGELLGECVSEKVNDAYLDTFFS